MIPVKEYQSRRKALLRKMDDNSMAILFSGYPKKCSADETYNFEVNRNFFYLTGIDQEDSILLLFKIEGEESEYLLVSPFDPVKEKWYGKKLTIEEASAASGVRNVLLNSALATRVNDALAGSFSDYGPITHVYLDLERENKVAEGTYIEDYKKSLETGYPDILISDIYQSITALRMVKSEAEIEELRVAIEATRLGILSAMSKIAPGKREFEIANDFHHVINDISGYQGTAFPTILASGVHTTCLHYPTPTDRIKPGDLVLMDLGSRHNKYCADISRTVPADGKFNELQRKIYSIVLACNKAVAGYAKPGLTIRDLQSFTVEFLASECLEKGLIKEKDEIKNYYFHGVSHHIGLDTHDPGNRDVPLACGNVISDEPGLYFRELGIGVRIEDDLLITEHGAEVLSSSIMKEIEDIERFYASRE